MGHQLYTDFSKALWSLTRLNLSTLWINQSDYLRKLLVFFPTVVTSERQLDLLTQWALATEILYKSVKSYSYAEVGNLN